MKYNITADQETFSFSSDKEQISIGRTNDNDFVVPKNDISRKHCSIFFQDHNAYITDHESKNGVIVDGRKIPVNSAILIKIDSLVMIAKKFELTLLGGKYGNE